MKDALSAHDEQFHRSVSGVCDIKRIQDSAVLLAMSGYGAVLAVTLVMLLSSSSPAPTPRIVNNIVSGATTGLEIPTDVIAGTGVGTGSMQFVVNVLTDSNGNIEVYTQ